MKTISLSAPLVALALGLTSTQALLINTPMSLTQCQPTALTWSGATGNVYLAVIPGGQPSAAPLKQFPLQQGSDGSYTWDVDLPAGTTVGLSINDANGVPAYSNQVTIISSKDDSCLNGGSDSSKASSTSGSGSSSSSSSSSSSGSGSASGSGAGAGMAGMSGMAGMAGMAGMGTTSSPPATGSGAAGTSSGGQAGAGPGASPSSSTVGPPPGGNSTAKTSTTSNSTSFTTARKNGTSSGMASGTLGVSVPVVAPVVLVGAATTALMALGGLGLLV